jgi:hypothetical protein
MGGNACGFTNHRIVMEAPTHSKESGMPPSYSHTHALYFWLFRKICGLYTQQHDKIPYKSE